MVNEEEATQLKANLDHSINHGGTSLSFLVDEVTRIANRQMQVVQRIDSINALMMTHTTRIDDISNRICNLENQARKPQTFMEKMVMPAIFFNMSLSAGNIALTISVGIALVNHMLIPH